MDVVCGRCRAEYEFDDALISERGTTVRCTNCGLQFKVFPPAGYRAPEVWRVYERADSEVSMVDFASLSDLQRAIAVGAVLPEHYLARGEEAPRLLTDIVELQTLLRQPISVAPPAIVSEAAIAGEDEVDSQAVVPAAFDAPDSDIEHMNRTALAHSRLSDEEIDPHHAIVPSEPPEASEDSHEVYVPRAGAMPSKPKIRSALSLGSLTPIANATVEDAPVSRRPSLSSSLAGGPPSSGPPSSDRSARSGPTSSKPSPLTSGATPRSSYPPPPPVESVSPQAVTAPEANLPTSEVHSESAPAAPQQNAAEQVLTGSFEEPRAPSLPASLQQAQREAAHSSSGQLTPTPLGMRAYTSASAPPLQPQVGAPAKRRATGLILIVSVVLGGAALAVWTQRHELADEQQQVSAASSAAGSEVAGELQNRVRSSDVAWWQARLSDAEVGADADAALGVGADELQQQLEGAGAARSWSMVHVLRMQGKLREARSLAVRLPEGPASPYALSMLDMVEESQPPWPLILERLKDASAGERPPFLARVAYIYSLLESDNRVMAQADFDAFGRQPGAKESPLYQPLQARLQAAAASVGEPTTPTNEADTQAAGTETAADKASQPQTAEPAEAQTPQPAEEQLAAESEPAPAPRISAETQNMVAEADALWRGGNRDAAVALYRKVVQKIGTSHFLGQRAAARIALAEREKAAQLGSGENQ